MTFENQKSLMMSHHLPHGSLYGYVCVYRQVFINVWVWWPSMTCTWKTDNLIALIGKEVTLEKAPRKCFSFVFKLTLEVVKVSWRLWTSWAGREVTVINIDEQQWLWKIPAHAAAVSNNYTTWSGRWMPLKIAHVEWLFSFGDYVNILLKRALWKTIFRNKN